MLSFVQLFVISWTEARQAFLSMEFSRQDWSGWLFPSPEDLPNPGIEPPSPALAGRFFTTEPPPWEALGTVIIPILRMKKPSLRLQNASSITSVIVFHSFLLEYSCFAMCVSFYCTAKGTSCMYTYIPSLLDFLPILVTTGH